MSFTNLLIISAVAFAAPLLVRAIPLVRVPSPVLEIVAGIVLGPSLLGWVAVDAPVDVLALVGLAFLLFLAGLEIDVHRLRGRPLQLAVAGFVLSFAIAVACGVALAAAGFTSAPLLVAIMLCATSLGLVVPVLGVRPASIGVWIGPGIRRQSAEPPLRDGRPRTVRSRYGAAPCSDR
jgi:Kef-type K+ transport system membrane component KefB